MGHFNSKALAFYAGAIAAVVILFSTVTAYGTSHLKAPTPISGRYPLSFAQPPNCLKSNALMLTIQQSGIYLNASLLPINTDSKSAKPAAQKPLLSGHLNNGQLNLFGPSKAKICASGSKDNPSNQIGIQGQVQGKTLQGQMTLSSIPGPIAFTARQAVQAVENDSK